MKYYLGKQGGWEDWFFGSKGAVSYLLTWFSIRDVYVCVCVVPGVLIRWLVLIRPCLLTLVRRVGDNCHCRSLSFLLCPSSGWLLLLLLLLLLKRFFM